MPTVVLQPVRDTLSFGQVNITPAALVWAGVGVGLATAIKLTRGLFLLLYPCQGLVAPAGRRS